MSRFIFHLPPELPEIIIRQLSELDLVHVSATSKLCREQLAPRIFRTIRFRNDEKVAQSAQAAVETFGHLTRNVEFVHVAEREKGNSCEPPLLTGQVLLPATRKLLSGHLLPNLNRFTFYFRFRCIPGNGEVTELLGLFDAAEHHAETVAAEERYQWRAVLNETYRAISENKTITDFILPDLIPISVSAFYTKSFRGFLGRKNPASIRLCLPSKCGGHEESWTLLGYRYFISAMEKVLFCHMNRLEHLNFHAAFGLPLAGAEAGTMALPLLPKAMPKLNSLKLANFFLCPQLIEFLAAHKETLSHICLQDCSANYSDTDNQNVPLPNETWEFFFSAIEQSEPWLLVQLEVQNTEDVLLDIYDDFGDGEDIANSEELLTMLESNRNRKIFSYGILCAEAGSLIIERPVNKAQAWSGKDSDAY